MKLLLDTELILWSVAEARRVPKTAANLMTADGNELYFSVASLWETTIKNGTGRADFQVDVRRLRRRLQQGGCRELAVEADHAIVALPPFHKDPFDRMLVAQAAVEGLTLLTSDALLSRYADYASIRVE